MLKKKFKFLLIIFMLLAAITFTISLAENRANSNDIEPISLNTDEAQTNDTTIDESRESIDGTKVEDLENLSASIKEYYKKYYKSYLGENTTNNDIYKMDTKDIVIDKNVSGNVFIMGNKVNVSSETIHGDIYIIASDVTITSKEIAGSAYIVANNLKIDNTLIDYSLYAVANNIDFYGASLDMYATANTITIQKDACVQRDLHSASNTLNLYGAVCRNAYSNFETLNLLKDEDLSNPETLSGIFGNFEYSSSESVTLPEGFVDGEVKYTKSEPHKVTAQDIAVSILESVVFMLVILAVLNVFANKFTTTSPSILANHLGKVVLKGLLFIILIPVLFVLLLILGITIRVAFVLLAVYFVVLAIATSVLIIALSNLISNKFKFANKAGRVGIFILTSLVYAIVLQIPYVSPVITIVIATLGVGIILQALSRKNDNNETNDTIVVTAKVESSEEKNNDNQINTKEDENKEDEDK